MNPPIEAVPCKVCSAPSAYQYVKGSFCAKHWADEYQQTGKIRSGTKLRINLSIWNEGGKVADLEEVQALFDRVITPDTVATAQLLLSEATERFTRKNKAFDGMLHYVAGKS